MGDGVNNHRAPGRTVIRPVEERRDPTVTVYHSPTDPGRELAEMVAHNLGRPATVVEYPAEYPGPCTHEVAVFLGDRDYAPTKLLWNNDDRDLEQACHQLVVGVRLRIDGLMYKPHRYGTAFPTRGSQDVPKLHEELGVTRTKRMSRRKRPIDTTDEADSETTATDTEEESDD